MHSRDLDWMALSRLPANDAENIFTLGRLLKDATVAPEMFSRLPKSYIANLFSCMQTEMLAFQHNHPKFQQIVAMKTRERDELVDKTTVMENRLKTSKAHLDEKKKNIDVLEETLHRLQSKLAKLQRPAETAPVQKVNQVFYCVYCKMGGFSSKDQFQIHMLTQHPAKSQESETQTVKEIVLALKQKEMALMEMVLKRNQEMAEISRRMADQELEFKTKQFQTAQCFPAFRGLEDTHQPNELTSQTSYVWFQKQNQNRGNYTQPLQPYPDKVASPRNNYVGGLEEYSPDKRESKLNSWKNPKHQQHPAYTVEVTPSSSLHTVQAKQEDIGVRLGLYTTQKQPLKTYKSSMECENSLYQLRNTSKISANCHIYFAGPLEGDDSDSEAADYFAPGTATRVIDEEIHVPQHLIRKQQHIQSNRSLTLKSMSSPQYGQRTLDPLISQLLSVDDKDFSLSKDSNSIDLSDLKFQKLMIKKQQYVHIQSPVPDSQKQSASPYTKKPNDVVLSQFYSSDTNLEFFQLPMRKVSSYKPSNSRLLQEFLTGYPSFSQNPRKSSKTEMPKDYPTVNGRKMERTWKVHKQDLRSFHCEDPPYLESQANYGSKPIIDDCFPSSMQSQIKISEPSPRQVFDPSQPPTQRLILEEMIDLTLIREQELQQSINQQIAN